MTHMFCMRCSMADVVASIVSGLGPAVQGLGNLGLGIANFFEQKKTNDSNIKLQREANAQNREMFDEQLDYARATQQTTWDREDSALQRGVQDARAAGLSPIAISGGAAAGQIVSQPSAPAMQAARLNAPQLGSINGLTELSDVIMRNREIDLASRNLDIKEKEVNEKLGDADADRISREKIASESLKNAKDIISLQIASSQDIASSQRASTEGIAAAGREQSERFNQKQFWLSAQEVLNSLALRADAQSFEQEMAASRLSLDKINSLMSQAKGLTNNMSSGYKLYSDKRACEIAFAQWTSDLNTFIESEFAKSPVSETTSGSAGANASGKLGPVSGSAGANGSLSQSVNRSHYQEAKLAAWFAKNPVPLYRPN